MDKLTDAEKELLNKIMNTSVRYSNSGIKSIKLEDLIDDPKLVAKIHAIVKKKHGVNYNDLVKFIEKMEAP